MRCPGFRGPWNHTLDSEIFSISVFFPNFHLNTIWKSAGQLTNLVTVSIHYAQGSVHRTFWTPMPCWLCSSFLCVQSCLNCHFTIRPVKIHFIRNQFSARCLHDRMRDNQMIFILVAWLLWEKSINNVSFITDMYFKITHICYWLFPNNSFIQNHRTTMLIVTVCIPR